MKNLPYIVTAILVVLTALFAILNRVWAGFVYFALSALLVLSLFWGVWLIYMYFTDFKLQLAQQYKYFRAKKIGEGQTTESVFNQNEASFKKEFNKSVLKDKIARWGIIIFCFGVALAFILGMVWY